MKNLQDKISEGLITEAAAKDYVKDII